MSKDLFKLSKRLKNFVVGMEGNISKIKNNIITIKASGSKLKKLKLKDLVEYDLDGNQLNNFDNKGSMELSFHTYLLKNHNINYVSHTHPTNTLKILVTDKIDEFANNRMFPDQVIFNGKKSCVVPYAKPGEELTKMIKQSVEEYIKNENVFPKLILLKNHGIICCGSTINECICATEICEKSAEIFLTENKINFLSKKEINDLINDKNEKYRLEKL